MGNEAHTKTIKNTKYKSRLGRHSSTQTQETQEQTTTLLGFVYLLVFNFVFSAFERAN